jgi:hypothetical protein
MQRSRRIVSGLVLWSAFALTGCPPTEEANNEPNACQSGYAPDTSGACADIDECATGAAGCAAGETCTNTAGGFACEPENTGCGPGYETKPSGICVDLNECDLGTDNCDPRAVCSNLTGSFSCRCPSTLVGDGTVCTDPACDPGYMRDGTGRCADLDECAEGTDNCGADERCVNAQGTFSCVPVAGCPSGFERAADSNRCIDIDECAAGTAGCAANERCVNAQGSASCVPIAACPSGYSRDANGRCADIDECATDADNCAADATCANLQGTFSCRCNAGFTGNGVACAPVVCNSGFTLNASGSCVDINECVTGANNCGANTTCVNTAGSFSCNAAAVCQPGYAPNASNRCADIDECATGANNCDVNATCTNRGGSFSCACKNGFSGDGTSCVVADCSPGFERDATGACVDINECATGRANCSTDATCSNTSGGFLCRCNPGFGGDGVTCDVSSCMPGFTLNAGGTCVDVNECATAGVCDAGTTCVNLPGDFRCDAGRVCPAGSEVVNGNCSDINECMTGANNCDANATCGNMSGGFRCTCKAGYTGDGVTCNDVDECATGTRCGATGICTNTPGSFVCSCPSGYKLTSPTTCADIDECNDPSANYTCNAICRNTPGSVQCLSSVADVNSPYWQYACDRPGDILVNNPTDFDMDCRCADQEGRPNNTSDPNYALFDRCRSISTTSIQGFGTGPGVREWRRQLSADTGSTYYNGGFLDDAERVMYVGAQWSDNRAFNGNPDLKNFGVVMAIDVNWDSPTVGNRRVISGKYLTTNGDVDAGSGPTLRAVKDVKRGPDGMLYAFSDEAGVLPQIMKIDPVTGARTLVWIEKEIYHPNAVPADQCENGSAVGQGGITNGSRKSLQINFLTNAWAMSPTTGEHYLSVTQSGPARSPYGVIKISADGSTCEWVTRFAANAPNKYAEIVDVAQRPADYGLPLGSGPRGTGLTNFGANPVNLHLRPDAATGKLWLYVVNGPGSGGTGMKYYRIDTATGNREFLFSGIMGDMFSIWDDVRQILWTSGGFDASIIVALNIIGSGGMAPAELGGLKCISTTSPWYKCLRGPGDADRQNRGGLFLDDGDGNLILAHGSIGFIRVEVRTGNTYIFSL